MVILGIDPGSRRAGYGVVEVAAAGTERLLACGVLRLQGEDAHVLRLKQIYDQVEALAEEHAPDACAIEMPVYGRNPQSMLKLGRAQAAAMLALLNREVPITEYTPKEIKKSVTGNGNADKRQVRYMVCSMLSIEKDEQPALDASDALATALCHTHRIESGRDPDTSGWAAFAEANPDRVRG